MAEQKRNMYTVIKKEDAKKYLTKEENLEIGRLLGKIADGRKADGKNPFNFYLVCNEDEPYARNVEGEILKGEQIKNTYECIESFVVDKVDDDGFSTDKQSIIRQGTMWEFVGRGNMCGKLRLEYIPKSKRAKGGQWIEIAQCHLDKYFKKVN